jgi:hypothetical protein
MIRQRNDSRKAGDFDIPASISIPPKLSPKKRYNSSSKNNKLPFVLFLVGMIAVIMCMGVVGIYIFSTTTNDRPSPPTEQRSRHTVGEQNKPAPNRHKVSPTEAARLVNQVRQEFYARYGNQEMAESMLERGITSFGSIDATANRMLLATMEGRPFVMAFSGYSVTVGRGNFFNQSFPFVVQRILQTPMLDILGTRLEVRNGAIGGIPSFPYGFCLEHFLGSDPDVISWDYSMNEGGKDASVLESFVRQATQQLPRRPMMILLDTNPLRTQLLKDYTTQGLLKDAISVGKKEVIDKKLFDQRPVPAGLKDWEEFGAPAICPGRGSWHPKKMEHELIGWMIAMHFLQALERAHQLLFDGSVGRQLEAAPSFPAPLAKTPVNDPEVTELLYGHATGDGNDYRMKDLSCRTSFLPATDRAKVLPSVVVSGLLEGDLDIMKDRTDTHYSKGWVLDVSKVERDTKRKVEACGGLGYMDMKIALYGVPASGTLRLWLPFEGPSHDDHDHDHDTTDDVAKHWFDDFIICEANEKRSDKACKLDQDMAITVGGVEVTRISPIKGAGEYLKRQTCVNVGVPKDAKVTQLKSVRSTDGQPLSTLDKTKFGGNDNAVGLVVDIKARDKVTRANGACCLSHIVWEQH